MNHQAGQGGVRNALMLNRVIGRFRDNDAGEEGASDGVLEERIYYCQNWKGDVVALAGSAGYQLESVRYSAYGYPFGIPGGDLDSDGDDRATVSALIAVSGFDPRADVDLDGDVDSVDSGVISALYVSQSLGRGVLSGFGSRRASQGTLAASVSPESLGHDRRRWRSFLSDTGCHATPLAM